MPTDRTIRFPMMPSPDAVGELIVHYFGEIALSSEWRDDQSRWYVMLRGTQRHFDPRLEDELIGPRWIEVFIGADIDVITRSQDRITCDLANGFARVIAERFDGEVEA